MKDVNGGESAGGWKGSRREVRQMLSLHLHPVEPGSSFSRRLEELCHSMGAEDLFRERWQQCEGTQRRGFLLFSALPFVGVAAYAVSKYLLRRRVVPMGV